MTCDRARELISDFLEGGLDRMLVARMEAHLGGCHACRREVEEVRSTWEDLDAVPMVEPPPDLVDRVISLLRRERAQELSFDRAAGSVRPRQGSPLLAWLCALSPVRVALGTSLATLILVGAFVFPNVMVRWFGVGGPSDPIPTNPTLVKEQRSELRVTIEYGPASAAWQDLNVVVFSESAIPAARVVLQHVSDQVFTPAFERDMEAGRPYWVPTRLRRSGAPTETLLVSVEASGLQKRFHCIVPPPRQSAPRLISLTFVDTALPIALAQMAEKVGRPVVYEALAAAPTVNAVVTYRPHQEAWQAMLQPLNLRAVEERGTFRVLRVQ